MTGKAKKLIFHLGQYKYIFLVLLVGTILLLWPSGVERTPSGGAEQSLETEALERKLERALSQVEGAGDVTVILTPEAGPRKILAQNAGERGTGEEVERQSTVILASLGGGAQEAVPVQQLAPRYRGALVIAQGANQPQVRLALTQAMSALTGLGADKISICQGK